MNGNISSKPLVLVTGASGYIASHVVQDLLDAGYRVKGTARGSRLDLIRDFWKGTKEFEAVHMDNIATSDLTDALRGVSAVIHIASPLPGKEDPEHEIQSAVDGTKNIMRQAMAQGITKFVVTSSWVSLVDPGMNDSYRGLTISEKNWGKTSRADLLYPGRNDLYVYGGAKIFSEQAAWELSHEHPELDVATILPTYVYGPHILPVSRSSLATVELVYQLIDGEPGRPIPFQPIPFYVDVRDIARAHVRALELPPLPPNVDPEEKRFLISNPNVALWADVVKYLYDTRPALRDRLPALDRPPVLPGPLSRNDTTHAKEVLGMKEYIDWHKIINDTIDSCLEAEKTWR